jgi:hypothetical protein
MKAPSLVTVGAAFGAALALVLSIGVAHGISAEATGYRISKADIVLVENEAQDAAKADEDKNVDSRSEKQPGTMQED